MIEHLALGDYYIAFKEAFGKDWKEGEEAWKFMHTGDQSEDNPEGTPGLNWRIIQRFAVFRWLSLHPEINADQFAGLERYVTDRQNYYQTAYAYKNEKEMFDVSTGFANADLFAQVERALSFSQAKMRLTLHW